MKKTRKAAILILLILILNTPFVLFAQTGFDDDTQDAPFDGGVSLLVAAGIAYGLKKAHDNKKQKNFRQD